MQMLLVALVLGCTPTHTSSDATAPTADTGSPTHVDGPYVDLVRVSEGVLGLTAQGSVTTWSVPGGQAVLVPGAAHLDVAKAGDGACAIDAVGEVHCYGDVPAGLAAAPVGPFVAFADAWFNPVDGLCALDAAGSLTCWGSTHAAFVDAPAADAFRKVVVSSNGGLGLRLDGTVAFWGSTLPAPVLDASQRFVDVAGTGSDFVGVDTEGNGVVFPGSSYVSVPVGLVAVSAWSVEAAVFLGDDGAMVASGVDIDFVTDAPKLGVWRSLHGDCAIRDDGLPHCWDLEPEWGALVWPEAPVQSTP